MATRTVGVCIIVALASLYPHLSWGQATPPTGASDQSSGVDAARGQQTIDVRTWTIAKTGPRFVTEGNVVRITGSNGWVRNRIEFVDFVLRLEYRATERNAEAAVLVRARPGRPDVWPSTGYRIAIGEGGDGRNSMGAVRGYGDGVRSVVKHRTDVPIVSGEWQELEIRADADRLTVTLNGTVVNSVEGTEPLAGYIGLEGSRGTVEFRNVRVFRLPFACGDGRPRDERQSNSVPVAGTTGIVNPRVQREVRPMYSVESMARQVEGVVRLEAVVLSDGTVDGVCIVRGLDEDLDAEAVAAAKRWRFEPGTRYGKPVAVLVTIELTFTLRNR